jgi:hypothetical protein
MGHNLGLIHTFETAYGFENINGSNSSTTADKVTDTKADPYAYNGNACFSTTAYGCTYSGTCQDPNGSTNFTPPYTNLMAYWWLGNGGVCVANPTATIGQFTRVESFLNTNAPLMACTSPSSTTLLANTVSSGYFMKSAINTLSTGGNAVKINSSAIATLAGGTVLLQPGFVATPNSNGLIVIKTKPCN